MNMTRRYLFTLAGLARLRERIAKVRAEYKAVCDSNEDAAGSGDSSVWHDNFAYEENQRQMHQLARRVRDLEVTLAAAEVVMANAGSTGRVSVGCWVTCLRDDDEATLRYFISGYDDGDPAAGRISYNSPLGRHLMGTQEGDLVEVHQGGRRRALEVVEVSPGLEEEPA